MATIHPTADELLGRAIELEAFGATVPQLNAGRGALFLFEGEGGIGKTTLAAACARIAQDQIGAAVVWGRCWEGGGAPPFWPWIQVARELAAMPAGQAAIAKLPATRDALSGLLPEMKDGATVATPPSESGRFALLDAMGRLLRDIGRDRPIVAILDDLHGADVSSMEMLHFVARDLRSSRLAILGTYRGEEARARPEVWDLLSKINREGELFVLQGLSGRLLAELIRRRTGRQLTEDLVADVERLTAGNPFFATEMARLLLTARDDASEGGAVASLPKLATRAVLRRLEPIAHDVRHVLESASVVGRSFDIDLVAEVASSDAAAVLEALQDAARHQLVDPGASPSAPSVFAHDLIRDAIYAAIPEEGRVEIHRRVAEALERRAATENVALSELAHHFGASASVDGGSKAFKYSLRAGAEALSLFAYREAVGALERALSLESATGPPVAQKVELRNLLAKALIRAGNWPRAKTLLLEAAASVRASGEQHLLPQIALAFGDVPIQAGLVDTDLIDLHEEGLRELGDDDSMERASLMARLGFELSFSPSIDGFRRRDQLAREALAMARRIGSKTMLARVLRYVLAVITTPHTLDEALGLCDEAIAIARETRDREADGLFRMRRCALLLELGRIDEFHAEAELVKRTAAELQHAELSWMAKLLDFTRAEMRGAFDEADRLCEDAAAMADIVPTALGGYIAQRFQLAILRGGIAEELIETCRVVMESNPYLGQLWAGGLAWAHADRGDVAQAHDEIAAIIPQVGSWPPSSTLIYALVLLAEAIEVVRDPDLARSLYTHLEPFHGHYAFLLVMAPAHFHGPVDHHLGVLATLFGDHDAAAAHFEAATAMAARVGSRPALVRAHVEQAAVLARAGDRTSATALATEARDYLSRVGLDRLARRADEVLAEIGGDRRTALSKDGGRASMVREGEYWTISLSGAVARLKHTKAFDYLTRLLAAPDREIHVLELVAAVEGRRASRNDISEPDVPVSAMDGIEVLDAAAKAAYASRLEELEDQIAEAEDYNDPERAARARAERDVIATELARSVGLHGRDRRTGSPAEQARVNITKHIRRLQKRIEEGQPSIARHFQATIKTGTFFVYSSELEPTLDWTIEGTAPH